MVGRVVWTWKAGKFLAHAFGQFALTTGPIAFKLLLDGLIELTPDSSPVDAALRQMRTELIARKVIPPDPPAQPGAAGNVTPIPGAPGP